MVDVEVNLVENVGVGVIFLEIWSGTDEHGSESKHSFSEKCQDLWRIEIGITKN